MKKIFKENFKFILCLILIILIFTLKFPYYIDAPGGISNIASKFEIDGYESSGTFNLAYVKEYKATIPTLLVSLFNKDWNVLKEEDVLLENEDNTSYLIRDKIFMDESISNAINVAYKYAKKDIEITSSKILITYIDKNSNTDLKVGDEILYINGNSIKEKKDIEKIVNEKNIGDKINIKVINDGKEYDRYAYITLSEGSKKIGILISHIMEYKTNPNIESKIDSNESGPSGGLIMSLYIYDSLIKEDLTKGLTIVGTGTIDLDGNVGSIGGVEYKLKSAVKENADLFIVPKDENYEEALKIKKENNYNIEILGVSTFDEVIKYLNNK